MSSRRPRPTVRPRAPFICFASAFMLLATVRPAAAGLHIVEQVASVDLDGRSATFHARFDSIPDLFTVDEFGRVADSFQYEIDAQGPESPEFPVGPVDAVVRGDEIHIADALRIRAAGDSVEPDPDEAAGGWGPVRATVPFDLEGPELTFEVPLAALGDDDGQFAYRLFTVEFGSTVDEVTGVVGAATPLPLPPGLWPALATAAALGAFVLFRRRTA